MAPSLAVMPVDPLLEALEEHRLLWDMVDLLNEEDVDGALAVLDDAPDLRSPA